MAMTDVACSSDHKNTHDEYNKRFFIFVPLFTTTKQNDCKLLTEFEEMERMNEMKKSPWSSSCISGTSSPSPPPLSCPLPSHLPSSTVPKLNELTQDPLIDLLKV